MSRVIIWRPWKFLNSKLSSKYFRICIEICHATYWAIIQFIGLHGNTRTKWRVLQSCIFGGICSSEELIEFGSKNRLQAYFLTKWYWQMSFTVLCPSYLAEDFSIYCCLFFKTRGKAAPFRSAGRLFLTTCSKNFLRTVTFLNSGFFKNGF